MNNSPKVQANKQFKYARFYKASALIQIMNFTKLNSLKPKRETEMLGT